MTASLAWVHAGQWWMGLVLYGSSAPSAFREPTCSTTPCWSTSTEEKELDLVSALGYSAGYIGGGLLFLVNVLMVQKPEWFGSVGRRSGRQSVVLERLALWWAAIHRAAAPVGRRDSDERPGAAVAGSAGRPPAAGRHAQGDPQLQGAAALSRRVLDLHRRREHRHQDGGVLWRPRFSASSKPPSSPPCS